MAQPPSAVVKDLKGKNTSGVSGEIRKASKRKPMPPLKGLGSLANATQGYTIPPLRGWIDQSYAAFNFLK